MLIHVIVLYSTDTFVGIVFSCLKKGKIYNWVIPSPYDVSVQGSYILLLAITCYFEPLHRIFNKKVKFLIGCISNCFLGPLVTVLSIHLIESDGGHVL